MLNKSRTTKIIDENICGKVPFHPESIALKITHKINKALPAMANMRKRLIVFPAIYTV